MKEKYELQGKQRNILFGEYSVIFSSIITLKEKLGPLHTANVLLNILTRNNQQFLSWLKQQNTNHQTQANLIRTLHAIVWNSPVSVPRVSTYLLFGMQTHSLKTETKFMMEHMLSSNDPNVVNAAQQAVRENFQENIVMLQSSAKLPSMGDETIMLLKKYLVYVTNPTDIKLLEKFIEVAKEGQYGKYVQACFHENVLLEGGRSAAEARTLQNKLFKKALDFQQEFDAGESGKFGMVSSNYPVMQNHITPNFNYISKLMDDLRRLDDIKYLSFEVSKGFGTSG